MSEQGGRLVRSLAFFRKDLFEVLRQPRMLVTLALGPFLILLLFGAGFIGKFEIRTVLVIPADSGLERIASDLVEQISRRAESVETTQDRQAAMEALATGEADVVAVIPPDALTRVSSGEQAEVEIIHNQIDPFERSVVQAFAAATMEDINNELWRRVIEESQREGTSAFLEPLVEDFETVDPEVVVSPFVADLTTFRGAEADFSHFYVPGVMALLLQHLALTFTALSVVRERTLGTVELFRVSPLSGGEILVGKYLAHTLLGLLVGAALISAAVPGLGFGVAGSWWWFFVIILLVLLAAQGAGFVVSAIARTESEAVQYAMILLLVAIFFSGFLIPLHRLIPPVRVISYLIPATYGIAGMQDIAFRGIDPSPEVLVGVGVLAGVFVITAWRMIRTRVASATSGWAPVHQEVNPAGRVSHG